MKRSKLTEHRAESGAAEVRSVSDVLQRGQGFRRSLHSGRARLYRSASPQRPQGSDHARSGRHAAVRGSGRCTRSARPGDRGAHRGAARRGRRRPAPAACRPDADASVGGLPRGGLSADRRPWPQTGNDHRSRHRSYRRHVGPKLGAKAVSEIAAVRRWLDKIPSQGQRTACLCRARDCCRSPAVAALPIRTRLTSARSRAGGCRTSARRGAACSRRRVRCTRRRAAAAVVWLCRPARADPHRLPHERGDFWRQGGFAPRP
jgi:hypothetical protein